MVWDPQRLVGGWRSVATRVITHTDSFSIADQKFFRSAVAHDVPGDIRLTLTDRKLSTFVDALRPKQVSKNYVLINRRYMLIYGLLRSGASVSLVGFDPVGRFLMHTCSVTERGVKGRYLTYETVVQQLIFEREK